VRLSLRQRDSAIAYKGIGFGLADAFEQVRESPFEVAFNIKAEQWRGETVLTLQVKDFRKAI
jgi:hypothetical protein